MAKDIAVGIMVGLTGFFLLWGLAVIGIVSLLHHLGSRDKGESV